MSWKMQTVAQMEARREWLRARVATHGHQLTEFRLLPTGSVVGFCCVCGKDAWLYNDGRVAGAAASAAACVAKA